jgi:DNA-directed RNA polymerase subunit RPC12/RpoP
MDVHDSPGRFRDPEIRLYALAADDIDVVCPRCGSRAVVTAQPVEGELVMDWPRRFVCAACASSASWSTKDGPSCWGGPVDPFFRLPLWLKAECCKGRTLWAFHDGHLALLEDYVSARLRERGPAQPGLTLVARLPAWLKSAKNRDEVLRVITRLRKSRDAAPG